MIITSTLDDILKTYPECKSLVEDIDSAMHVGIHDGKVGNLNHKKIIASIILIEDEVVAWAWCFSYYRCRLDERLLVCKRRPVIGFMVYVKEKYRRRGFAKKLFYFSKKAIKHRHRSMVVFPWDQKSESFFDSLNIKSVNKLEYEF